MHFQCNTYGKWQVFSSRYRHQLCYSFSNKQPPRYKSTHNLPHCHSHRSQKYKIHNTVLDSPIKIPTDLLSQMYLLHHVLMRERALNFCHPLAVYLAELFVTVWDCHEGARTFCNSCFCMFTYLVDLDLKSSHSYLCAGIYTQVSFQCNFSRTKLP